MSKKIFFVSGTDTEIGKTLVSSALLVAAANKGLKTIGLKPVAAGCEETAEGLRNSDALSLQRYATEALAYEMVNPVALKQAKAPHIAAANENRRLSVDRLVGYCRGAMTTPHDFCVVEGAGGWRVPLNPAEHLSGLPKALEMPVILVVGIRLGCLNHALLSAECIARDGLSIAGWVANCVDPKMEEKQGNIDTLRHFLPFPYIGEVPFMDDPNAEEAAKGLDISKLVN